MKKFLLVCLFCGLAFSVNAEEDKSEKRLGIVTLGAALTEISRDFHNDDVEVESNPLLLPSISLSLWPDTFNLTITYSELLEIGGNGGGESFDYMDIYVRPIKAKWGEIGLGLFGMRQNVQLTNKSSQTLVSLEFTQPDLASGQSRNVNYKEDVWKFSYTFPELAYMPNKSTIAVGFIDSRKATVLDDGYIIHDHEREGVRLDVGVVKTNDDLKNGFNIKRATLIYALYDDSYGTMQSDPETKIRTNKDASSYGFNLGVAYKGEFNAFGSAGHYIISGYREQIENEERDVEHHDPLNFDPSDPEANLITVKAGRTTDINQGISVEFAFYF